jgi:basic amino acid/polyamine antiporter, APA family
LTVALFCRISATSLASEYVLSAAAIARAFTSYAGSLVKGDADFFRISTGSEYFLIDVPALFIVFLLCGVLAAGTRSGALFNTIVTLANMLVIAFVLSTGLPHLKPKHFVPFLPMGVRGAVSGASRVRLLHLCI